MSIATELTKLRNNKAAIKAAITTKTGTDAGDDMSTYATKISNISGGGGDIYKSLVEDDMTGSVVIPEGVTRIRSYFNYSNTSITSLNIPSTVTSIGDKAFYNCNKIKTMNDLPDNITLGAGVFSNCTGGTKVDNVYYLGNVAVRYVSTGLTSYSLAAGTKYMNNGTTMSEGCFGNCKSATTITLNEGLTSIGNNAFHNCSSLTSVTIPNSVTSIGNNAFSYCSSLTSVTIPNSVTSIGSSAFHSCSSLTSVTIPNSVTSIGNYAFYGCSGLTTVTIGSGVRSIGAYAFYNCPESGTLYCNEDWYNNLSSTNKSNLGNLKNWTKVYI